MPLPEHEVRALIDLATEQPGITVAVDLVTETVTCGDLRFGFHLDPFVRKRLLEGLDDISSTLEHEEAITAFEAQRPAWMPDLSRTGSPGLTANVVVLPGDGIGPEVVNAALSVLAGVCTAADAEINIDVHVIGGRAIDEYGTPLPDETLDACRDADAVLLGAVGGPAWDHLRGEHRCEAGLLKLRQRARRVRQCPAGSRASASRRRTPLRRDVVKGTDLIVVRELTGRRVLRAATRPHRHRPSRDRARQHRVQRRGDRASRARRVRACGGRRGELISIDKANVLITSQLWREVVSALAPEYPTVTLTHELVDSFAMRLVREPATVDVIVAENLFGDILSDEAAVLAGSLGLLPSASLGATDQGLYEPIHGSAPSLAGRGVANPYGAILSVAMMLRHSLHRDDLAAAIEAAVDVCISEDVLTAGPRRQREHDAVADAVSREAMRALAASSEPPREPRDLRHDAARRRAGSRHQLLGVRQAAHRRASRHTRGHGGRGRLARRESHRHRVLCRDAHAPPAQRDARRIRRHPATGHATAGRPRSYARCSTRWRR